MSSEEKIIAVILGDHRLPDPIKRGGQFNSEDLETINKLKHALHQLQAYYFMFLDNHATLKDDLSSLKEQIWLVLNFCDEGFMNDPRREKDIPVLLDELGLPYTGAGVECMERCFDKSQVLTLAQRKGVPIPRTYNSWEEVCNFPVIIKPNFGDGGFGITAQSVVNSGPELIRMLNFMRTEMGCRDILIQEFLTGQDLTCGIIDGEVLPIIEEDYSVLPPELPPIQGYEAKWQPDSPYWQVKSKVAELTRANSHIIADYTKLMFNVLGCRDYARIDWRLNAKGIPRLLEVNPNPGWCWDGHLAKSWATIGRPYEEMLLAIIQSAAKRNGLR